MVTLAVRLALASALALAVATDEAVEAAPQSPASDAAVPLEALGFDDECDPDGSDGQCALNAVQLRAQKKRETAAAHHADVGSGAATRETEEAGSAAVANRTAEGSWPFTSDAKYQASCFGNAGSVDCSDPSNPRTAGRCVCANGCMGADGNCYPQDNKVVAKGFTLSNLQWPTYKMYVQRLSVFGQMKTTSFSSSYNMGQDLFTLYELPGKFEGRKEYFLASHKWPDYVVAVQATGGTAVSLWGAYSVSLTKYHQPWHLRDVMLRICSARKHGHPDAVMIGTSVKTGGSTIWAYIHEGSYFVYGYWYPERLIESSIMPGSKSNASVAELPGIGGYWVPKPPFKRGLLPDC